MLPAFSLLAPCQPGVSTPQKGKLFLRGQSRLAQATEDMVAKPSGFPCLLTSDFIELSGYPTNLAIRYTVTKKNTPKSVAKA